MSPPSADDGHDDSQSAAMELGPEPSESEPSESESEPSESEGLPDKSGEQRGIEDDSTKETGLTHDSTVSFKSQSKGPDVSSGIDIAPMDNIVAAVNENLGECRRCKKSGLRLELDRRIGFASNWKLACASCDKIDLSHKNSLNHLKRYLEKCPTYIERRKVKQKIVRKRAIIRKIKT